jgi:signal transduction histidine kinase
VRGDESLLLQMLLNLIDNAIRYTERGEVAIGWETAGRNVELIVQDTGPGIPEEQLERIFEPFYRIDPSRAYTRGAGLGLSICRTIARAHGGEVSATTSELGATFVAALPLATEGVPSSPGGRAAAASTLRS